MAGTGFSGTTATVAAGTRLVDLYNSLAAHGRAIPGGSCPTVGISGLTLGGGIGVVARAYGLTSDSVELGSQIVTANGAIINANAKDHADRDWACRGGGGGQLRHRHLVHVQHAPRADPGALLPVLAPVAGGQGGQRLQPRCCSSPTRCGRTCTSRPSPANRTPTIQVGGCYLGSIGGAAGLLDQLYAKVGSHPTGYFLNQFSYLNAMLLEAGCSSLGYQACHLPWQVPGGRLNRQPQYSKSDSSPGS